MTTMAKLRAALFLVRAAVGLVRLRFRLWVGYPWDVPAVSYWVPLALVCGVDFTVSVWARSIMGMALSPVVLFLIGVICILSDDVRAERALRMEAVSIAQKLLAAQGDSIIAITPGSRRAGPEQARAFHPAELQPMKNHPIPATLGPILGSVVTELVEFSDGYGFQFAFDARAAGRLTVSFIDGGRMLYDTLEREQLERLAGIIQDAMGWPEHRPCRACEGEYCQACGRYDCPEAAKVAEKEDNEITARLRAEEGKGTP